jgi:hypothetical protein
MKTDSKQTKILLTKKTDLLKLLHLPTMHGLLRQKRIRWVGHALRRADSDLSKVGKKRVGTEFKAMDKVPVGRHEGAQHQEHKRSGRHFQEKGCIPYKKL